MRLVVHMGARVFSAPLGRGLEEEGLEETHGRFL